MKSKFTNLPKPAKIALWVLLAVFAYALPLLEPPFISTPGVDFGGVLFTVTIYCLVALGLNIVVGYAGLLDPGYVGFYAIGAYTACHRHHLPRELAVPAGTALGCRGRDALWRAPRRADPASTWRLPRHRDARLQ
ncbi:ABC transporter permease subunit [Nocardioides sp. B-3]|uniref:ABC transporter permease subunit n=1 Tax=Nocardioides sp. B-3 TaxID=2895565 RepID=UPI0021FBE1FB|nr:hypothetical protein LP418_22595 [Nocardioides sp. B-3]